MTITYHAELIQGTDEWLRARMGILTASEMKLIVTPGKLQYASNDKSRAHLYELAAQRISNYVEPHYVGDDMLRGQFDEIEARKVYSENYGKAENCGFITSDKWGFVIGYSPDALVGDDGLVECKSRRQKYQIETIASGEVPAEYLIQCQTGLLVSEREWLDFISYSGGLPMFVKRVFADAVVQGAIISAAGAFYEQMGDVIKKYSDAVLLNNYRPTERVIFDEINEGVIGAGVQWDKDATGSCENFMFGRVKE